MEENNRLYVGKLPYSMDDAGLSALFSAVEGVKVTDAKVIIDRNNDNKSKGFGFVTLETAAMTEPAIAAVNGKEVDGQTVVVNIARPKEDRPAYNSGSNSTYRS